MAAAHIHATLSVLTVALFLLVAPLAGEEQNPAGNRRGRISGASHVNLRSGPGISHPPVTILQNGETVHIETLEGSWYRVTLSPGITGYIFQEFIEVLDGDPVAGARELPEQPAMEGFQTESPPEIAPIFSQVANVKSPAESVESTAPVAPEVPDTLSPPSPSEIAPTTPVSIMKDKPRVKTPPSNPSFQSSLLWAIAQWVIVPICIFTLGWIFGGNYYLRRDRIERNKLRF